MSISLEQIFDASLRDLEKVAGDILKPLQRKLYNSDPSKYEKDIKESYVYYVTENYYKNNRLDVLSTWLIKKYDRKFWVILAGGVESLDELLSNLD